MPAATTTEITDCNIRRNLIVLAAEQCGHRWSYSAFEWRTNGKLAGYYGEIVDNHSGDEMGAWYCGADFDMNTALDVEWN